MSYILDALRKSQHDRETGLSDPRADGAHAVAAALQRTRRWVVGGVLLLLANLGVLGAFWWQSHASAPAAREALEPAQLPAPGAGALRQAAAPAPAPRATAVPEVAAQSAISGRDIEEEFQFEAERHAAARGASSSPLPDLEMSAPRAVSDLAAADDADAVAAELPSAPLATAAGVVTEEAAVPVYLEADLTLWRRFPGLRLDVHVFSEQLDERFVFINTKKYREGENTAEGLHVDAIVADGVILSYEGQPFRLLPQ